jgi:alpha-L-rhamnosidase
VYDARLEQGGWDTPGFDDGKWAGVYIAPQPAGKLCAQASPADKVMGRVKPVNVTEPAPGMYVFDLGQTFSGWARLRVRGPAGTKVLLRFAGEVKPDGMLDFRSAGGKQIQSDTYILKGQGEEEYVPRFTWHCFRYVEVTGFPGPAGLDAIQGQKVHSAVSPVGEFKCSNPLINRIQEIFRRTQLANYHGCVPSDCPHRERLGYTGDGHLTTEAAMLNFSVPQLYTKWLRDIGNAQNRRTGFVPHTAPFYGGGGGPAWGSAYVIVSWLMYLYYADTRALEEHWAGLERWMAYLAGRCDEGGIVVREEPDSWCLGDWSLPGDGIEEPPHKRLLPSLVNTFYYGYCAQLMGRIAKALGRGADAERYRELEKRIAEAFHRRFFDAERGCYSIGHFGTDAFGLALGAPPPDQEPRVLDSLLRTIEKNNGHLDTGIMGTAVLPEVLVESGHADVAYAMLAKITYPSFGFMVERGATTLWENWAERTGSHCHPMYGSVSGWFYRHLAGIGASADGPGFRRIIIRPQVVGDLTSASGSVMTVRGEVAVAWNRTGEGLKMDVTIPHGASARILIPALGLSEPTVVEGERPLWAVGRYQDGIEGISSACREGDAVVVEAGGGRYCFDLRAS